MRKILLAVSVLVLVACKKEKEEEQTPDVTVKETYTLPGDTLFPEGIAYSPGSGFFYTGSVTTGDILKVELATKNTSVWAAGGAQGRKAATGMKFDSRGRLWVCGGLDNKVSVHSTDGTVLKMWDMSTLFGAGFVNDCTQDGKHIYFTDSRVQKIYRASVTEELPATMEEWLSFTDAQIPYVAGSTNANGIVHTPDDKYLLVVVSASGKLYRISKNDKSVVEISLNTPVTSGDGLVFEGDKLYICRNALNQIYPVTLSNDYSTGTVGAPFGNGLKFNTTMVRVGDYFLVVNGQLNKRATKDASLPFTVSRVSIP